MKRSLSLLALALLGSSAHASDPADWLGRPFGLNYNRWDVMADDGLVPGRLGIKLIRRDLPWSRIEVAPGIFNWTIADRVVEEAGTFGRRKILILAYGNSHYTGAFNQPPTTQAAREAFARYAFECARRYRGQNVIWEIWNEPNSRTFWGGGRSADQYAALLRWTIPAIKRGDPDAVIAAPALTGFDRAYLDELLRIGIPEGIDYFTLHPYNEEGVAPDRAQAWMDYVRQALYNSRVQKLPKIGISEWSYLPPRDVTANLQSSWQARIPLSTPLLDAEFNVLYTLRGFAPTNEIDATAGLITHLGIPTDTYRKVLHLGRFLSGSGFVGELERTDPLVTALIGRKANGGPVIVAWSNDGLRELEIPAHGSRYLVSRSISDNRYQAPVNNRLRVTVSQSPLVIEPDGPDPLYSALMSLTGLPRATGIGFSQTRQQYATALFHHLRGSSVPTNAVFKIESQDMVLPVTLGTLRTWNLGRFVSELSRNQVILGDLHPNARPFALGVELPNLQPIKLKLGFADWPGTSQFQVRTIGTSTPEVVGFKPGREELSGVVRTARTDGTSTVAPLRMNAGQRYFRSGISSWTSAAQRVLLEETLPGLGTLPALTSSDTARDTRLWQFGLNKPKLPLATFDTKYFNGRGTCRIVTEASNFSFIPAARMLSLYGLAGTGQLLVEVGGNVPIPRGTTRLDFWMKANGPVRSVNFSFKDGNVIRYTLPQTLEVGEWTLVQVNLQPWRLRNLSMHHLVRAELAPGADRSQASIHIAEIRSYQR